MPSPRSDAAPPAPHPLALAVLCAAALMMILDETIVNVALSSIQDDLGFSPSGLAWVVNAYIVAFGGMLLLAGRLGDLVGRRRVFQAGLALFVVASLVCGLATGPVVLVVARFVQGVGAALTSAVTLGMVVTTFSEPRAQARAIGAFSFSQAAGGSIGLVLGGLLTQATSWHWVFFVNVPIGLAAAVLAQRVLPDQAGIGLRRGADALGGVLVTAGLMLAVATIVGAHERGWADAVTVGGGLLALALIGGFVARQATATRPLLPLRLLRSGLLARANLVFFLLVGGIFGFQFVTALYLQRVLGYGPAEVGVAMVPVAIGIGVLSLGVAPKLLGRVGPRPALLGGMALVALGLALLARLPADGGYATDILPALLPLGVGFGVAMPAITTLAMSGASGEDSGVASGIFATTQQVSAALGLAVVSMLAASRTEALLAAGRDEAAALTAGYRLAYAVGAGLVLAALATAAVLLRPARAGGPAPAADGGPQPATEPATAAAEPASPTTEPEPEPRVSASSAAPAAGP